jgi:hypothetical protein
MVLALARPLVTSMIAVEPQDRQRLSAQNPRINTPIKEIAPVSRIRFCLTAIAVAAAMSSSAIAQTSVFPPATKTESAASAPDSSKPSTATQVEKWTTKQWEATKKEWAKDKAKWADCQKQSRVQKLEGRKSWSFLYNCMTS